MTDTNQTKEDAKEDAGALWDRLVPAASANRVPQLCGDIDMKIDMQGMWHYQGSPIARMELVRLFATILRRDPDKGGYWLATPAEMCRITVEDAPFLAVEALIEGRGADQIIGFRTNVDEAVRLDTDHPLRMGKVADGSGEAPYITVRPGLEARATRSVYYQLADRAEELDTGDGRWIGLWSSGSFFPLGPVSAAEDQD